jgi:hypothetical protein
MNKSAAKQLDKVLMYLDNDEQFPETHLQIKRKFNDTFTNKELYMILEKLCDDKLTNFNYLTKVNGDNTNTKTYYITIHGRLFLERGGFMYETKIQTRQTIWTIAKTTAAILNAISILAIGICGIYVSNQLNIKDIKISELEFKIDSLTKNTVKHNKTK